MIEAHMQRVLELASQALDRGELPIAAAVVLGDEVLATATTSEREERRYLVHAELDALLVADRLMPFPGRRQDTKLIANVEPCFMCTGAAMSFFVGEIHFGVESPTDGALDLARGWVAEGGHLPGYRFPSVTGGVLRDETLALFQKYVRRTGSTGAIWKWANSIASLR